MHKKLRIGLLTLATFLGGYGLGQASVQSYQAVINGFPSTVEVLHDKDTLLVPLTLPASSQPQEWTVSLLRDDQAHKVNVTMVKAKQVKLRGLTDCYYCTGNGMCPNDYPAGSGRTGSGYSESLCSGTGRCYHCSGTGKL